jgi:hypothetical protein
MLWGSRQDQGLQKAAERIVVAEAWPLVQELERLVLALFAITQV